MKNLLPAVYPGRSERAQDDKRYDSVEETRIAWLAPSLARGWRWQSLFKEFSKICPNTIVFTGFWPGFTQGFEGTFRIEQVPGFRYWGSDGACSAGPALRPYGSSIGEQTRKGRPSADGSESGRSGTRSVQGESGNRFMWASPRILARLARFRPQIILTNGFHVWTLCALLAKLFFNSRLILLWQGVSPETGGEAGTWRLKLRRQMARFFDRAVTNTEEGVRYLEGSVGIPPARVTRLVGEVADKAPLLARPNPAISLHSLARPVFLFVGRLVPGKGVEQFLTACSLLVHRGVKDFSLVLVGDGPSRNEFVELAHELCLERHVHWEGFVLYEELGAYYDACDVVVLPSLEDTWGVVTLEAMAFAMPVLVSCYAGASEVVEHGVNGFVFDPYKPQELAAFMMHFIEHPAEARHFGKASNDIMACHTPRQTAERLAEVVRETLEPRGTRKFVMLTLSEAKGKHPRI